ncbi:hypothetical protein CCACVL1_00717, partial [Corchorus capsularis]
WEEEEEEGRSKRNTMGRQGGC